MANQKHIKILKQGADVWNQWRKENPTIVVDLFDAKLNQADLRDADLREANLLYADLSRADLSRADLSRADLSYTNLSYTNLIGAKAIDANISYAHLSIANVRSANLTGANLTGTNLTGARLSRSWLQGSNLEDTLLQATIFADMDLSGIHNLDKVVHRGPCYVSFETLFNEANKDVPEIFWRGCGVPEDVINYLPSFTNNPIQFYSCFISYSHKDKDFARRLHDTLQGRGIRCWLDEHQLLPGDKIFDRVDEGIRLWDKVLLCCSEASLTSWWVDNEINKAFVKEQALQKQRGHKVLSLIPLDLDGYLFKWTDGKADEVRSRLAPDFKGWKRSTRKFDEQVERVIKALRADAKAREMPPIGKL